MSQIGTPQPPFLPPGFRLRIGWRGKLVLQIEVGKQVARGYMGPSWRDATVDDIFALFMRIESHTPTQDAGE